MSVLGTRVDVYCDLTRRVSSVRALSGGGKGRVVEKPASIVLEDVTFRVNPGGLRRTRETRERRVFAFARGTYASNDTDAVLSRDDKVRIRFNPLLFDTFVVASTGEPVSGARILAICGKTAWAVLPS